jgi:formate dehydrogenase gamma subunit
MFSSRYFRLLLACGWLAGAALAAAQAVKDSACLDCHSDNTLTTTNAAGKAVSLFVDAAKLKGSSHRTNACVSCHADLTAKHPDDGVPAKPVDCARCHALQATSYAASVHGLAVRAGDGTAPGCTDCHDHHNVLPPTSPESPLYFSRLAQTCGECHDQESQDVQASVHGHASARGEREAATCIDCHNEHQIEKLKGASSDKISEGVCSKCHASERINAKFNLPADRVKTFLGSYHGMAVQGGSASAANCASCHGFHKILPSRDPASTINRKHLVETCGKCHPGATANFAYSPIHVDDQAAGKDLGAMASHWVRRIYLGMIFAVVGALSAHNLIAWLRSALAARRRRGVTVTRMSRHHRIQHFILLSSFILLALTGFALKYPDTWLAWMFGADENVRRWLHRGAGVVLIGIGFYHLGYILVARAGRELVRDFWPRWQDARDLVTNLRYLTGHGRERAKFGRFGYPEKLEYWAVAWGIIIMGLTGLMIWFKMDVTKFLPRWIIDVAVTVHYYEAILACLAIVVWHFYHVIFAPDSYPMNWAWWDGQVTEEWQHEEHPLDHSTPPPAADQKTAAKTTGEGI